MGKTFINLSLVTRQPFFGCWSHTEVKPQAPKYLDAMFHGKISEVDAKHCMTMSDIARTEDGSVVKGMQRCILVEGAPSQPLHGRWSVSGERVRYCSSIESCCYCDLERKESEM